MSNVKLGSLEVENFMTSSGSMDISSGFTFLGDSKNDNHTPVSGTVPSKSYMGTSETNCQFSRSLYDINTTGPIRYTNTSDDKRVVIQNNISNVTTNPVLTTYPWMYPENMKWSADTETAVKSNDDIFKCLGKGLGEVVFYKVGDTSTGQQSKAGYIIEYLDNGTCLGFKSNTITNQEIYPFNGKIYSGTLVQLKSQLNVETGIKETVVIPYQAGRGIPRYAHGFQPSDTTALSEFLPFGQLTWNNGDNLSPSLSEGVSPSQNNTCIGVVLDTYSSEIPRNLPFIYTPPTEYTSEQLNSKTFAPWHTHPAPHTIGPKSVNTNLTTPNTQGFLSPGPGLSGNYYSPWPGYYAYKSGDPIPILTSGITTIRIGAAYNVALMNYGLKQKISSTDESWVPVQCIPLFQGERLEAGSYIYASVKGNIYTGGPIITLTPPERTFPNNEDSGILNGTVGQTPYDNFIDSTYGNYGWTGTPGLSFSNIPDTDIPVAQTLPNSEGNVRYIPGLQQSNQGSMIVHPITSVMPYPALGNAFLQKSNDNNIVDLSPLEQYNIRKDRFKLPGVSGRCMLAQTVPEKSQCIGVLLETIIGSGKWAFTGLPLTPPEDYTLHLQIGGADYRKSNEITPFDMDVRGGTGIGMTVQYTTQLIISPNLGTMTTVPTIINPGAGYIDGDIITIQDQSLDYNSPMYRNNNAAYVYDSGLLTFQSGGNNYDMSFASQFPFPTFNLTDNSVFFKFEYILNYPEQVGNFPSSSDYPQDFTRYPIGTIVGVLDSIFWSSGTSELTYFSVNQVPDISAQPLILVNKVSVYPVPSNPSFPVYETIKMNYNKRHPDVFIEGNPITGTISFTGVYDWGIGNVKGDKLLIISNNANNNNAIIDYPGIYPGFQEIINGFPGYYPGPCKTFNVSTGLNSDITMEIIITDPLRPDEGIAIAADVTSYGTSVDNVIYSMYIDDPLNYNIVSTPWYHGRHFLFQRITGPKIKYLHGGSGYTPGNDISTYNLTANQLRLNYLVDISGVISINPIPQPITFDSSKYIFDSVNGTIIRVMYDLLPEESQRLERLVSLSPGNVITTEVIREGAIYIGLSTSPLGWVFQTQRNDQAGPEVTVWTDAITKDGTSTIPNAIGAVRKVKLKNTGISNEESDLILIIQRNSGNNAVFLYSNNMEYLDVPPYANPPGYNVDRSTNAWDRYTYAMSSSVNLLDKEVLVELRQSTGSLMENVFPSAQSKSVLTQIGTNDPFQELY
jgi:hypothetical protein